MSDTCENNIQSDHHLKTQAHGSNGIMKECDNKEREAVDNQETTPVPAIVSPAYTLPESNVRHRSQVEPENTTNRSIQGIYGTFLNSRPTQYEELFGGSMACPTCRGTGRIPRDTADEMVALIPVSDKRLKPRRTCLYVCIAVGICTLIAGLLLYFLLPRNIQLTSHIRTLHPHYRVVNKSEQIVFLTVRDEYNITNNNYFPVYVTELDVTTSFDQKTVGESQNHTRMMIPIRATIPYTIELNITFDGSEGYIAYYCSTGMPGSHSILMPFIATMSSSYLGHSEETTLQTYKHVLCGPQHIQERHLTKAAVRK